MYARQVLVKKIRIVELLSCNGEALSQGQGNYLYQKEALLKVKPLGFRKDITGEERKTTPTNSPSYILVRSMPQQRAGCVDNHV
jgi:hypothetical protein